MFYGKTKKILFCYFLFAIVKAYGSTGRPLKDHPSTKANTLSDDADDIQKQLDNEARDKAKYNQQKTVWVFHFPSHIIPNHGMGITESLTPTDFILLRGRAPSNESYEESTNSFLPAIIQEIEIKDWNYKDQQLWRMSYPACGGTSQSPVNLPFKGMVHTTASRQLLFSMYDKIPNSMTVVNNGKTFSLFGEWDPKSRPMVYGGAAHSRRYVFHSLAFRFPSEHTVGGLSYPLESQAMHVSVEYASLEDAIKAGAKDRLAMLVVANIYMHSNHNHEGLEDLIETIFSTNYGNSSFKNTPLMYFNPLLREYAAYHGSLTVPPCTESVLWLVRARSLPITRDLVELIEEKIAKQDREPGKSFNRFVQPLNDRSVYFFN